MVKLSALLALLQVRLRAGFGPQARDNIPGCCVSGAGVAPAWARIMIQLFIVPVLSQHRPPAGLPAAARAQNNIPLG
jgi:hypothetical protein